MVDFKSLRASKAKSSPIHPIEIFRRLPSPPGIFDLSPSQKDVLDTWFDRREEKDLVIKMHTGGGKTLVGLLIAQSILREIKEPVLYVCPTIQLVNQTHKKAAEYGIPTVTYNTGSSYFPNEFLNATRALC